MSPEAQKHPYWAIVDRVATSQCFQSSTRLREFLFYVSDCALRDAPEEATEQHIGIHVFQRIPGFNSGEDSIVRTHARSLRQKLGDYFGNEGLEEDIVISIPKGHYLPVFTPRVKPAEIATAIVGTGTPAAAPAPAAGTGAEPVAVPLTLDAPLPIKGEKTGWPGRRWGAIAAAAVLILAGIGAAVHHSAQADPVERFWSPFFAGNSTLVIFSNAVFIGDSTTGLRYAPPSFNPQEPLPSNYVDDYTGIGELTGVYELTRLFDRHHASFQLKRSLLVTWDEARLRNLIFIGSVAENPSLRALPSTRDFSIMAGNGFAGIVDHHPLPGEPALYQRPEHPLTKDYAILALLPGLQPGKQMLVCSGLTTMGTQAAVEFVSHPETLAELLRKVTGKNGQIQPFEAVLETSIIQGVPLETRLVTVHVHGS